MIPKRRSGSWLVRGLIALPLLVLAAGALVWRNAQAPDAGSPDATIRPLFAPLVSEAPSRENFNGSVHDSIRPIAADSKPVHSIVVYVHGISCHSPDYYAPFQFRLAKALGMSREPSPDGGAARVSIVELTPSGPKPKTAAEYLSTEDFAAWRADASPAEVKASYFAMRRRKVIPQDFATACSDPESGTLVQPLNYPRLSIRHFGNRTGDRLSVIEVLWSPLSERQKLIKVGEDLNLDASALRSQPLWPAEKSAPRADVEQRALANQMLKSSVINGAIADAIFYLGDGGPAIRAAVMAGVVQAMSLRKASAAAGKHSVRFTIVTESLGSRIAFDTMREAPDRFAEQLDDTIALLKSNPRIVMFANQLPLLDIANQVDRSIVSGASFEDELARHAARIRELHAAGEQDAGTPDYKFFSRDDPPSWRACGEAFGYYIKAATLLADSPLGARFGGASAKEMADNAEFALTHPLQPVMALFGQANDRASIPETLKTAQRFAGDAMAFLAFSPGGMGYANCQRKVAGEKARVDAYYAARSKGAPPPDIVRAERLLKIASDVRASKIADIDAISNSRASVVFGLLYQELAYLSARCDGSGAPECNADAIKARLRRVAGLVPRIEVAAFSDPNDLLSYRVTAEQYQSETFNFINVPIRLADPIVPAAGRWGGFTPPMEAHTNHKFDDRILAMLICGWDTSSRSTFAAVNGKPCPLQLPAGGR